MSWNFQEIHETVQREIKDISSNRKLESFRIKYLGRKGLIPQIYSQLATLSKEERPSAGKAANNLKKMLDEIIERKRTEIRTQERNIKSQTKLDVTIPGVAKELGNRHILSKTVNDICGIFEKLGFTVMEGPEIETEFNNFTALNIPVDHPSRDAFDTFYLNLKDPCAKGRFQLLRSHTSPAQIRIMKSHKPPLAVVIPGRVYRPDAVDASHSFMFHQIEGLLVDRCIKFSDLKGIITVFIKKLFGEDVKMRFRPHFFPFTEPSAEVDISSDHIGRKGWLEIMGCGSVHPKVFDAVGYPKNKYTGLAFGLGVERIAMLKHGINDIRLFFENDKRFLKQF